MDQPEILLADLSDPSHQSAIRDLIAMYAREPEGGGQSLPDAVLDGLVPGLVAQGNALVFLAFVAGGPAGIAVCFRGFSTFAARPLLNIHDFAVAPPYRRQGVARALLAAVEAQARRTGCCKLTLEVLERNHRAQGVYRAHGFEADPSAERSWFFTKKL